MREHHWDYRLINEMYLDAVDHEGLEFWYEDVVECIKEIKSNKGGK